MVYLVGAGPGDPGLITVRGLALLEQADVVVHDALANPKLLEHVRRDCLVIDAGKRARRHKLSQDQINATLADHAAAGRSVVRLKGGDPYVFGRGSEEAIYLHERGIGIEVVPGITAAIAAAAYAGIPVTHRGVATTCTFVTGHEDPTKPDAQTDYPTLGRLVQQGGTVCLYMAVGRLAEIAAAFVEAGCEPATPAALVQWGTLATQRSVRATLADLPSRVAEAGLGAPAIVVVGPVAGLDARALSFFEDRPLFGRTIVVTRTRQQASDLSAGLAALGANVIEAPTIRIDPPDDWAPIDKALADLGGYDWLVLSSANGVTALAEGLERLGRDSRALAGVSIAAVGPATAAALREHLGVAPDCVPQRFVAEGLADELVERGEVAGRRLLLLRADIARPLLVDRLVEAGGDVTDLPVYHTRRVDALDDALIEALRERRVDWLTFTSSSTARNFVDLLGDRATLNSVKIASIGPKTTATLEQLGLRVSVEADPHDIGGLIEAVVAAEG